jgi:hypothetical protein
MTASRFPCRACGLPTEGLDTYVICADCALDFERRFRETVGDGFRHLPEIAGATEARLRRLLDDW